MNTLSRFLAGLLLIVTISPDWVVGQNAVLPGQNAVAPKRALIPAPGATQGGGGSRPATLSSNYTITLTVLSDDKPVGEVVVLTASPEVRTNVPLNVKDTPSSVSASGDLSEGEDGKMTFIYSLGFSVPVVKSFNPPAQPGGVPTTSVQYQQHQSSGSVLVKLGKTYDLLKAGGYVYRLMIDKAKDE